MSTLTPTKTWQETVVRSLGSTGGKVLDYSIGSLTKNFWPELFWGQDGRKGILILVLQYFSKILSLQFRKRTRVACRKPCLYRNSGEVGFLRTKMYFSLSIQMMTCLQPEFLITECSMSALGQWACTDLLVFIKDAVLYMLQKRVKCCSKTLLVNMIVSGYFLSQLSF